jgi:hypothetical protein
MDALLLFLVASSMGQMSLIALTPGTQAERGRKLMAFCGSQLTEKI